MAQTSFDIDAKTSEALETLKKVYGVSSNAAAIRRALAIALVASRYSDKDDNIVIVANDKDNSDGKETRYVIPQNF